MEIKPQNISGYKLLHEGAIALSKVTQNGIRIDVDYCKKKTKLLQRRIEKEEARLERSELGKAWKSLYSNPKWATGNQQLGKVLYEHLGFEITKETATGKGYPTDAEALEKIDIDGIESLRKIRKWYQTKNTFFAGILREQVKGVIHPFWHLHKVQTYRSSSSNPNWQNVPTRDPEIGKLVRQAIYPRKGHLIGEIDFSGVEVRIAACYHGDKTMIYDILHGDMHRDIAMKAYMLSLDEMGQKGSKVYKSIRYGGKNGFVFPQFYGDYYINCAVSMWRHAVEGKLVTAQGIPLKAHLKKHGVKNLEDFKEHIKKVENWFWKEKYGVYGEWREKWYANYRERGYIDLLTGFRCSGLMRKKQVINYAIQGAAFHCLLLSLILLQKYLEVNRLKTRIIGQIHDSIILDIHPYEFNEVLLAAKCIMEEKVKEVWEWIKIPLEVEAEISPKGASWHLKKEVKEHQCQRCVSKFVYPLPIKGESGEIISLEYECPLCGERGV